MKIFQVCGHFHLEILEGLECFAANLARKVAHRVMNVTHVARSLLVGPKRLSTFVANKRMFASVNRHVNFQVRPMLESNTWDFY